jgi:hypothetical protein
MVFDPATEEMFLGIAHALFMNRLHVLRLTEIVRLQIRPNPEDQNLEVPDSVDAELIQQAFDYVAKCFPAAFSKKLDAARARWIRLA